MKHLILPAYVIAVSIAYGALALASEPIAQAWGLVFVVAVLAPITTSSLRNGDGP
jgi:hypothetical protein